MDPATLTAIYTVLAALGLVATDTYVNANTVYLDTTVAKEVAAEGYKPSVVNGVFIAEVKRITRTPSLVAAPLIQSSETKPISVALAEFARLDGALGAMQSLMGIIPPKLVASVVTKDQRKRLDIVQADEDGRVREYTVADEMAMHLVLTGYDPKSGYFDINVKGHSAGDDFDHLIRDAAFEAVLKLDPYLALLYDINRRAEAGDDLAAVQTLIDQQLLALRSGQTSDQRALMENLHGIVALLERDQPRAREYFRKAIAANPRQPVGYLNLAFLDVHEDRFEEAVKNVEHVIYPSYWPMTGNPTLLATGYIIKAVAESEMRKFGAAEASFKKAAALHPQSSEVYVYWARMLRQAGRTAEADRMVRQARQNAGYFENYPEMALLYFWLTEQGDQPLQRRTGVAETL